MRQSANDCGLAEDSYNCNTCESGPHHCTVTCTLFADRCYISLPWEWKNEIGLERVTLKRTAVAMTVAMVGIGGVGETSIGCT